MKQHTNFQSGQMRKQHFYFSICYDKILLSFVTDIIFNNQIFRELLGADDFRVNPCLPLLHG